MRTRIVEQGNMPTSMGRAGRLRSRITSTLALPVASVAAVALVITGGAVANAWGPQRETFTMQNPPDFITFDSITNNPDVGDERNFLRVRDADEQYWDEQATNGWTDTVNLEEGHTYDVRLYVHNNGIEGRYIAQDVRAHINLPTGNDVFGKQFEVNGYLYASNAQPQEIWDNIVLKSDKEFHVKVVSSKYYNNVRTEATDGFDLGDELINSKGVGSGALLGYDQMNGYITSCLPFSGYVLVKIQPVFAEQPVEEAPSYDIEKAVDKTEAKAGDTLKYTITVENTGNVDLTNVKIVDELPAFATNATQTVSVASSYSGSLVDDGELTIDRLPIGDTATIEISYTLNADNLDCGETTIVNTVSGTTDQDDSEDDDSNNTVTTVVTNDCPEPVVPGAPEAGTGIKTAVVSLVAFMACGAILTGVLLRKKSVGKK